MAQSYCGSMANFLKRMARIFNQPVKNVFVYIKNAEKLRRSLRHMPKKQQVKRIEAEMRIAEPGYLPFLENARSLAIEPPNVKARRAIKNAAKIIATNLDVIAVAPPLKEISYPFPIINKVQFGFDVWRFIRNKRREHLVRTIEKEAFRHDYGFAPKLIIWTLLLKAQKIRFLKTMERYNFKDSEAKKSLDAIEERL